MSLGILPAQLDSGDTNVGIRAEGDSVQGGGTECRAVTGVADFTGIHGIVAEIQAVASNSRRQTPRFS